MIYKKMVDLVVGLCYTLNQTGNTLKGKKRMNETVYKLNEEQQKLPQVERTEGEKQIFADGSYTYGVEHDGTIHRHLPSGYTYIYKKVNSDYILKEERDRGISVRRYYDNGQYEMEDRGTRITHWYENGQKKSEDSYYYEDPGINTRINNGTIEWYENGRIAHVWLDCGFEEKYNKEGDLTYHMTHGIEDTSKYLAIKKVAERQAEKSKKMRQKAEIKGKTPKKAVVKKLKPLSKAIKVAIAKAEISRGK